MTLNLSIYTYCKGEMHPMDMNWRVIAWVDDDSYFPREPNQYGHR